MVVLKYGVQAGNTLVFKAGESQESEGEVREDKGTSCANVDQVAMKIRT